MTYQDITKALSKICANQAPLTVWVPLAIHEGDPVEILYRTEYSPVCPVRVDVPVYEPDPNPDYNGQMQKLETLLGHPLHIEDGEFYHHILGYWQDDSLSFCAEILIERVNPYRLSVDWVQCCGEPQQAFNVRAESWEDALYMLECSVENSHKLTTKVKEFLESGKVNG